MEWLVTLIVIVTAGAAIALWASAWLAEPPDAPSETSNGYEHPGKFLRFQPPARTDVFQCSSYYSALAKKRMLIWDYRDKRGELHSGVAPSLEQATTAAQEFGYHPNNSHNGNSRTA
jgi:hypothetical protein